MAGSRFDYLRTSCKTTMKLINEAVNDLDVQIRHHCRWFS